MDNGVFTPSSGSSFETNNHQRPVYFNNSGQSVESVNDGYSSYLVSLLLLCSEPAQPKSSQVH